MPGPGQGSRLFYFVLWIFIGAALVAGGCFEKQPLPEQFWNVHSTGEPVLRLHVIANSDKPEDQMYKRQVVRIVRQKLDRQGAFLSAEACRDYVNQAIPTLEDEIRGSLPEPTFGPGISVTIGRSFFPLRAYGNQVFPPGEYLALKVIIGAGEGENWWCLLFPPLCTSLSEYDPEEEAAAGAGAGDHEESTRSGEPVRRRFLIWEWLKGWFQPKEVTEHSPLPAD